MQRPKLVFHHLTQGLEHYGCDSICAFSIFKYIKPQFCILPEINLSNHRKWCFKYRLTPHSMLILSVIINFLGHTQCTALSDENTEISGNSFTFAVDFLIRYGYLPKSDFASGALRSEEKLKVAISNMQKFANIFPSGNIDNDTVALMKRKRCGVPDVHDDHLSDRVKRYALQGSKWSHTDLTWSVKQWSPNIDHRYVNAELKKAFKVWADASKLTFTETRRADADIVISFLSRWHGDEYPFDGPGSILAHAFFPGTGIGGDAHFDAEEQWAKKENNVINDDGGVSLFAVAVHEFGHSLGLSHSSVQGSLMFPYYQIMKDDFKLPYDDRVGIQQLYGSKTTKEWAPMPSLPSPFNPTISNTPKYPSSKIPPVGGPETPKSKRPTYYPIRPTVKMDIPNACNTSIDAIASIRRDIFIFKGKYFWWLKENKSLIRDHNDPIEIYRYFIDLPKTIEKIDAVYERPTDKKIVFFTGRQFWVFDNTKAERGYPRPLTDLGLPQSLEKIDAAMIWGYNGKTYLFNENVYWRLEEEENRVELDYPRDMSVWKGVPNDIDAAFQWTKDGQTYFFKNKMFWHFDNRKMKVIDAPQYTGKFWFESICKYFNESQHSPITPVIVTAEKSSANLIYIRIYYDIYYYILFIMQMLLFSIF